MNKRITNSLSSFYALTVLLLLLISAVAGMHTSAIKNGTKGRFLSTLCPVMPDPELSMLPLFKCFKTRCEKNDKTVHRKRH